MGPKGFQGIQGPPGDIGDTGPNGTAGEKGQKGEKGMMGLQGDVGEEGELGPTGQRGLQGKLGGKKVCVCFNNVTSRLHIPGDISLFDNTFLIWQQQVQIYSNLSDLLTSELSPAPGCVAFITNTQLLYVYVPPVWVPWVSTLIVSVPSSLSLSLLSLFCSLLSLSFLPSLPLSFLPSLPLSLLSLFCSLLPLSFFSSLPFFLSPSLLLPHSFPPNSLSFIHAKQNTFTVSLSLSSKFVCFVFISKVHPRRLDQKE